MAIERLHRRIAASRLDAAARDLLEASALCAIATVSRHGRPHVNTAYFAWTLELDIVWISDRGARHSRNIHATGQAAAAVYDTDQSWCGSDRGIQLLGDAAPADGAAAADAARVYAARFPAYREDGAYRLYVMRTQRVKLFDEARFGDGVFVTARRGRDRSLAWERTDISRPER